MTPEIERVGEADEAWAPRDAGIGLLLLSVGVGYGWLFFRLLDFEPPLAGALLIVIGGTGWLAVPLLVLVGANAVYQSLAALVRRGRATESR